MSENGEFQVLLKPVKKIHDRRLINQQYAQLLSEQKKTKKKSFSLANGQGLVRSTECFCSKIPFYEYDLNGYASFIEIYSAPLRFKPI